MSERRPSVATMLFVLIAASVVSALGAVIVQMAISGKANGAVTVVVTCAVAASLGGRLGRSRRGQGRG